MPANIRYLLFQSRVEHVLTGFICLLYKRKSMINYFFLVEIKIDFTLINAKSSQIISILLKISLNLNRFHLNYRNNSKNC